MAIEERAIERDLGREVMSKVTWRLIPFMFLMYIFNYLDRVNVSLAALSMKGDLGLSDSVYGMGAGIFFLGYFFFEVPSNLILARTGARLWITRIMLTWGVISSCMLFVKTPTSFYALRFALGMAEAGFFPGMILYLTYWFPARQRARTIARFMTATTLAGVIGGPMSAALLQLNGVAGLKGWQWLFLAEGIPSFLLGFVVLFYLTDRPEHAKWLTEKEKTWLIDTLRREETQRSERHGLSLRQVFVHRRALLFSLIYFLIVVGSYGMGMWGPLILKSRTAWSDGTISNLWAIPSLIAAVGMMLIGLHSDHTDERRGHVAGSAILAALGLALSATLRAPVLLLLSLSLANLGIAGTLGPFWSMPTAFLSGAAAAGGIAMINSIGNLGGFLGPFLMGELKSRTSGFTVGLFILAAFLLAAGLLALAVPRDPSPEEVPAPL
jgi:ACS family tartrate transporter-like MFS transporter